MSDRKVLCLHGAGTSAKILKSQLGSMISDLEKDLSVSLVFLDGPLDSEPHPAIDGIYEGPYKTWFTWSGEDQPLSEDVESILKAFDLLYDCIEEQGPFEAVLGFSQGSTIAAAFLLYHQRQNPIKPAFSLFKYGIFFSAAAIVDIDPLPILRDGEKKRSIQIPTLHILGKKDDLFKEGIALSKVCSPDARVLTHAHGHCIPRDSPTVRSIVKAIENLHFNSVYA